MLTSCWIPLQNALENFTIKTKLLHFLLVSALLWDEKQCLLLSWRASCICSSLCTLWYGWFLPILGRGAWCVMLTPCQVLSSTRKLRWSAPKGDTGGSFQCKVICGVFSCFFGLCQWLSGSRRSDLAASDSLVLWSTLQTVNHDGERCLSLCPTQCFRKEGKKDFCPLGMMAALLVQNLRIEFYT